MCPAADKLSCYTAISQSGAEKQENSPAKYPYQTEQYGGIMVPLPPRRYGPDLPCPQVQGSKTSAKNNADIEPPVIAELLVLLIAEKWMVLRIFRCGAVEHLGVDNDKRL